MAEEENEKEEKFEFDPSGEAVSYISLEQARVIAARYARENRDFYGRRYARRDMIWEDVDAEEGEDYYYISLSHRPAGQFRGEPGIERFTIDKTGPVERREIVRELSGVRNWTPVLVAAGALAVAGVVVGGLFAAGVIPPSPPPTPVSSVGAPTPEGNAGGPSPTPEPGEAVLVPPVTSTPSPIPVLAPAPTPQDVATESARKPLPDGGETISFETDFSGERVGPSSIFRGEVAEEGGNRFLVVPQRHRGWQLPYFLDNQRISFKFRSLEPGELNVTTQLSSGDALRYHTAMTTGGVSLSLCCTGLDTDRPQRQILARRQVSLGPGVWHEFSLTILQGRITVALDGQTLIDHTAERLPAGRTHLQQDGGSYQVDDFQLVGLSPSSPIVITLEPTPVPALIPRATPAPDRYLQLGSVGSEAKAFSEPILARANDLTPHFEDDFSTTDKGWRHFSKGPDYQGTMRIQDGVMRVSGLVGATEIYGEDLSRSKDFVFQVDVRMVRGDFSSQQMVYFHHAAGSLYFNMVMTSRGQSWRIVRSGPRQEFVEIARGGGDVSPLGQVTRLMLVVKGDRGVVYLNSKPVVYLEDSYLDSAGDIHFDCVSASEAVCEFDNVKFWDLAKLIGSP